MKRSLTVLLLVLLPIVGFSQQPRSMASFFKAVDALLGEHVVAGNVDYEKLLDNSQLDDLVAFIAEFDYSGASEEIRKAYLINAYNLLVINGVVDAFPIQSTLKIYGFFDQRNVEVAGRTMTLDHLEKQILFKEHPDPRLHFALSCAAVSCPDLADFAYTSNELDTQLEERTTLALGDSGFIRMDEDENRLFVSRIFDWYRRDFGESKMEVIQFINRYREHKVSPDASIVYNPYDWTINAVAGSLLPNNTNRYVVSSTIPAGEVEVKWFNNLYSQKIPPPTEATEVRESYFTSILSFVYGISSRFNLGFDLRYRRFSKHETPATSFDVFSVHDAISSRAVLATLGPKVRFAPNPNWPNFSIQSAFWFPLKNNLSESPWIDWGGSTWWTQAFNDFDIGSNFALFTELDVLLEDIGSKSKGRINRLSTPVTGIFSYFPTPKSTLYAMINFSPYWTPNPDYFFQPGLGTKYQITGRWEVELLYTYFTNDFIQKANGSASTINLGIRYSSW